MLHSIINPLEAIRIKDTKNMVLINADKQSV